MKKPNGWIAYKTLSSYTIYSLMINYKDAGEELMYQHMRTILKDRNYIEENRGTECTT
jgi:hypothetical protein